LTNTEWKKIIDGADLAGWHIVIWYEVLFTTEGHEPKRTEYFDDHELVVNQAESGDVSGKVSEVHILSNDDKTGFVVNSQTVELADADQVQAEILATALTRLRPVDRRVLGIDKR